MARIKTGIIGTGKVAHLHAVALQNNPHSEFVAGHSRSRERVDAFAQQYGIQGYTDLEVFFEDSGVEAVLICTPHPAHAEAAVMAAELGVHILVEKALASSLEDCDAMLDAARKSGVKFGVISQRRYYECALRVKNAIDSGKLGKPILGIATVLGWRSPEYFESDPWRGTWAEEGGGVLVNQAVHQLDMLLWYMGEIDQLFGYWGNLNHPSIEVEDTAIAVIRFKSGALGQVTASNSYNPAIHCRVSVLGENGASVGVQTDGGQMFIAGQAPIEEPPVTDSWMVPGEQHLLEEFQKQDAERFHSINAMEYYHQVQIDDFIDAILEDREPAITGEDGRRAVELFTAIYRSQRDGKPIQFPLEPEYDRDDFDGRRLV